jgi:hypothetical protein
MRNAWASSSQRSCEPEGIEESGLEAANRVCCGEQVLAQLRWLDRRPIRIRDEHD